MFPSLQLVKQYYKEYILSLEEPFQREFKKIIMVTYQSFEKFINSCISENININKLIYDEAHHIV